MAIPVYNEEMKKFIHGLLNHLVQSKGSDLFITAGLLNQIGRASCRERV